KPTVTEFHDGFQDSCYLQATVGILPSAVRELFLQARKDDGLHHAGGQYTQINTAVLVSYNQVATKIQDHKYIKGLQDTEDTETIAAICGVIHLVAMYLIGDRLSQTAAFPGGSIKNAVSFLAKIDPSTFKSIGTAGMRLFDEVPDEFVTEL